MNFDFILTICDDGTCCCLPARTSIFLISVLSMGVTLIDFLLEEACDDLYCTNRTYIETGRVVLLTMFQVANVLLLGAAIIENAILAQLYVWYTLCFVILGLIVSLLDFLHRFKEESVYSLVSFVPEVAFLFVLYRCLPIVDSYRKYLESLTEPAKQF